MPNLAKSGLVHQKNAGNGTIGSFAMQNPIEEKTHLKEEDLRRTMTTILLRAMDLQTRRKRPKLKQMIND